MPCDVTGEARRQRKREACVYTACSVSLYTVGIITNIFSMARQWGENFHLDIQPYTVSCGFYFDAASVTGKDSTLSRLKVFLFFFNHLCLGRRRQKRKTVL